MTIAVVKLSKTADKKKVTKPIIQSKVVFLRVFIFEPRPMAGALICITLDTKKQFEIGTGLDDEMRKEFWKNKPLAKIVTFKP